MSYDEEEHKRSRVVIETPTTRREVTHQQTVRYPEERRGYSTGVLVAVALTAIAATAIIFLFVMNSGDDDSTNVNVRMAAATQPTPLTALPPPVVVQTPLMMPTPPPIIIQQPPMTTVPPPVVIQPAPPTTTAPPATSAAPPPNPNDDATLQQKIDRVFEADAEIKGAVIDATVIDGKVLLTGTVNSAALKQKAERLAYAVKGVRSVDNKIAVTSATP